MPPSFTRALASAASQPARHILAYTAMALSLSRTCETAWMPFISEIVCARPMISSARSAWSATARARSQTWSVSAKPAASRNTRSAGTSTSSKTTIASEMVCERL